MGTGADWPGRYRQAIGEALGGGMEVSLFWKGRVALYSILKALGVGPGDEVIIPGLTCVVVPNAVIYAGARPVYADVDPATYTLTPETVRPLIGPHTRAIIAQNSFGLSADLDPLLELVAGRGIELIDDCTHGFGGRYKGRPNGSVTRVAFFSTQWNKPFSTGIGGFAVTRDPELGARLRRIEAEASRPSRQAVATLWLLLLVRRGLMREGTYWPLLRLYRWLSARNLVIGSSQGEELRAPRMPEGFLRGLSGFQARVGLRALRGFAESARFRQGVAGQYDRLLGGLGRTRPARPHAGGHLFLKYPLRVQQRGWLLEEAERHRVRLGDWFNSPLHPVQTDLSPWGYGVGSCPDAEAAARELLNLPTDPDLGPGELERVMGFLRTHKDLVR